VSGSIYSSSWYRVSTLKPSLRGHTEIHRHHYRGELWYVLQDHAAGKHHRLTPATYFVVGLMNGERSVDSIWHRAVEHLGDDAPTQDEIIGLLGQLHGADVLRCDVSPDALELFRRYQKQRKLFWKQRIGSPLSVRIPLWDPDRFLRRTLHWVKPILGWFGAVVWIGVVGIACVQAGIHWNEITGDIIDKALAPSNLVATLLVYPFVKALHELGHAYVVRNWGGEVHELGIMFLVFIPVPYVDASAAWSFRDKRKRMLVGAAGILVEAFLASLALLVWLAVEPGSVRAVAYSVMLIGGISTVLFNGNPLLRFDGYHIFADAVEIPNLGSRANTYLTYILKRYVVRDRHAQSPVTAPGERFWLPVYGLAALLYRLFIMLAIVVFVASKFFFIGVMIAIWSLTTVFLMPVWKSIRFFVSSPTLARQRGRATRSAFVALAVLALLVGFFPAPLRTQVEGVVWLPEEAMIRAGTAGSVMKLLATPNSEVDAGDPLFELEDPFLPVRVKLLESRLEELQLTLAFYRDGDKVMARNTREQITEIRENLVQAQERLAELLVKAPASGVFVVPYDADMPGRFVRQGELIGYILDNDEFLVRAVIPQHAIALVREQTERVELRVAGSVSRIIDSAIERQVPGALDRLPNAALGSMGGGDIAVDPRAEDGLTTFQGVFQVDLSLPPEAADQPVGTRVYVKFEHGTEPLAAQVYRSMRRLLLRQFNV
jgi:putative peptide zinc metalloprotease protein